MHDAAESQHRSSFLSIDLGHISSLQYLRLFPDNGLDKIQSSGFEPSSRNLSLEQNIQLHRRPSLGFGNDKERKHDGDDAAAGPEEAGLGTPVPGRRVELVGGQDAGDDGGDGVGPAGEDDGFAAKEGRGNLGAEGVGEGADGAVVEEGGDKEEGADCPGVRGAWAGGLRYAEGADQDHYD